MKTARKPTAEDLARFAPEMRAFVVDIDSVTPHPRNVAKHDAANLRVIGANLRRNLQRWPILVQKSTGFVVCGNGRLEIARSMGWRFILATFQKMSDSTAREMAIADNLSSDLHTYDQTVFVEDSKAIAEENRTFAEDLGLLDFETEQPVAEPVVSVEIPKENGIFIGGLTAKRQESLFNELTRRKIPCKVVSL